MNANTRGSFFRAVGIVFRVLHIRLLQFDIETLPAQKKMWQEA
jgi:hypothetical protein